MPFAPWYAADPRVLELGPGVRGAPGEPGFFDVVRPARFPAQILRYRNDAAAKEIGLDALTDDEWRAHFGSFAPLPDNLEAPLALRYHGHQFDVYNPAIGDGRGFLHAQVRTRGGRLLDLATKGSGRTPYSRGGDGKLTLKGGVREVLATELLAALGVPTSKSFSLIETGEALYRGDEPSPTRSSVLVRLGHSHLRIGTFQRAAYERGGPGSGDLLERLLAHAITRYFPRLDADQDDAPEAFLLAVSEHVARLTARFMVAGFVHGVLNSDNVVVTGEGFDYGPYRFLPVYDPAFVAAYFDETGLYAYGEQPKAMLRNVLRLAAALRPIAPSLAAGDLASRFEDALLEETRAAMTFRLGVVAQPDVDPLLVDRVFEFLFDAKVPFDRFFFDAYGGPLDRSLPYAGRAWEALREVLSVYRPSALVRPPYFGRSEPVSLVHGEVEAVWSPIAERDDWGPFEAKIRAIRELGAALSPEAVHSAP